MRIDKTTLKDCYIIHPDLFGDERGYFSPYFIMKDFYDLGFEEVVQANRSKSAKGVLRGLHYQEWPYTQAKVVNVVKGKAMVVIVDIRKDSPTYGKWINVLLTEDNHDMIYVPRGFAHGFLSLEDDTIYEYLVDNLYGPTYEKGILWNDPELSIPWKEWFDFYDIENPIISEKDTKWLSLNETEVKLKWES